RARGLRSRRRLVCGPSRPAPHPDFGRLGWPPAAQGLRVPAGIPRHAGPMNFAGMRRSFVVSAPHESPKNLAESLAADAEKLVAPPLCHARGEEPANHIRELAQAIRLLARAVNILAAKVNDLDRA